MGASFGTLTPIELRALVPAASHAAYLNAAASSPIPVPVADAIRAHIAQSTERGDVGFPRWLVQRDELRARIGKFIGGHAREIAILPSTSLAFSIVANMLVHRGVREVVTLEGEFPSTTLPLLHAGLTLRAVRMRADGSYAPEDIEAACTKETGAIAASIVQFSSGFRVDLDALRAIAKSRSIALCLNGSQALGHVPIDVTGADFFCAACHKWLMAGYGNAVLFVRESWLDACPLPFAGWLSVETDVLWKAFGGADVREEPNARVISGMPRVRKEASALEVGGGVWALYPGLDSAVALHEAVGPARILEHDLALQKRLRDGLRARGFRPNAPDDPRVSSGITVVPVENAENAVRALLAKGVVTTPRGGGLRISTHVYNDASDVERALAAIDEVGIRPC